MKENKIKYVSNLFLWSIIGGDKQETDVVGYFNYSRHFRIAVENWQEICVKESLYDDK